MRTHATLGCTLLLTLALDFARAPVSAQVSPPPRPGTPETKVVPGERYHAGTVRRFLLGDTYRDLWCTPITVPVLDLQRYAGGLTPTNVGGGKQTKSLRLKNPDGGEFVFRLVDKEWVNPPPGWENTVLEWIARDQVSAHHPAGAVVADTLLSAAGVVHPQPMLAVMPDDPALGEFRKEFAGRLGCIEPLPTGSDHAQREFAGAIAIIDSDSLQVLLDTNPRERLDAHAYLTARLVDMFLNDWDRHAGNWKWAKTGPNGRWIPIARDRDKVMIGYGGIVAASGKVVQQLVSFKEKYPHVSALTVNSRDIDRRFLSSLGASAFDSVAVFLKETFTDAMLESALRAMPDEYQPTAPETLAKLKARRDAIPQEAARFYRYLSDDVDIHATDAPERATVTLVDDRHVDVEIRDGSETPYYQRRFDAAETREVRLYMHGGDDRVEVRGNGAPPIDVRIVGGNGNNQLKDWSRIAKQSGEVKFYDQGAVTGIRYGPEETKAEKKDNDEDKKKDEIKGMNQADEEHLDFDRRPWIDYAGREREIPRDYGANTSPVVQVNAPGDLGIVPGLGVQKTRYGFRKFPYASRMRGLAEYSTLVEGWRLSFFGDKRLESSAFHPMVGAQMSELEVLNFYGYGNDTPGGPEGAFQARQQQWQLFPVIAYAVGTRSDIVLGPVFKYSTTEDVAGRFITGEEPYGYGDFGQVGLRVGLFSDSRDHSRNPGRKVLLDLTATVYPAVWDVAAPFGVLSAVTATYLALPIPVHPVLALKAGGRQVIGSEFPFHEAAFIGGRPSQRDLPRERYAGDASLYGTAELRIPVLQFALLFPWDTGVYLYGDAGRVYMDGDSPGGWHTSTGVGVWIGILSPAAALSVESGENPSMGGGIKARIGLNF